MPVFRRKKGHVKKGVKKGAPEPAQDNLLASAQKGDEAAVLACLQKGRLDGLQRKDEKGRDALMWCCRRGLLKAAEALLKHGVSPLHIDNAGHHALAHAILCNSLGVASMLLTVSRKVLNYSNMANITDRHSRAAMNHAIRGGNIAAVRMILKEAHGFVDLWSDTSSSIVLDCYDIYHNLSLKLKKLLDMKETAAVEKAALQRQEKLKVEEAGGEDLSDATSDSLDNDLNSSLGSILAEAAAEPQKNVVKTAEQVIRQRMAVQQDIMKFLIDHAHRSGKIHHALCSTKAQSRLFWWHAMRDVTVSALLKESGDTFSPSVLREAVLRTTHVRNPMQFSPVDIERFMSLIFVLTKRYDEDDSSKLRPCLALLETLIAPCSFGDRTKNPGPDPIHSTRDLKYPKLGFLEDTLGPEKARIQQAKDYLAAVWRGVHAARGVHRAVLGAREVEIQRTGVDEPLHRSMWNHSATLTGLYGPEVDCLEKLFFLGDALCNLNTPPQTERAACLTHLKAKGITLPPHLTAVHKKGTAMALWSGHTLSMLVLHTRYIDAIKKVPGPEFEWMGGKAEVLRSVKIPSFDEMYTTPQMSVYQIEAACSRLLDCVECIATRMMHGIDDPDTLQSRFKLLVCTALFLLFHTGRDRVLKSDSLQAKLNRLHQIWGALVSSTAYLIDTESVLHGAMVAPFFLFAQASILFDKSVTDASLSQFFSEVNSSLQVLAPVKARGPEDDDSPESLWRTSVPFAEIFNASRVPQGGRGGGGGAALPGRHFPSVVESTTRGGDPFKRRPASDLLDPSHPFPLFPIPDDAADDEPGSTLVSVRFGEKLFAESRGGEGRSAKRQQQQQQQDPPAASTRGRRGGAGGSRGGGQRRGAEGGSSGAPQNPASDGAAEQAAPRGRGRGDRAGAAAPKRGRGGGQRAAVGAGRSGGGGGGGSSGSSAAPTPPATFDLGRQKIRFLRAWNCIQGEHDFLGVRGRNWRHWMAKHPLKSPAAAPKSRGKKKRAKAAAAAAAAAAPAASSTTNPAVYVNMDEGVGLAFDEVPIREMMRCIVGVVQVLVSLPAHPQFLQYLAVAGGSVDLGLQGTQLGVDVFAKHPQLITALTEARKKQYVRDGLTHCSRYQQHHLRQVLRGVYPPLEVPHSPTAPKISGKISGVIPTDVILWVRESLFSKDKTVLREFDFVQQSIVRKGVSMPEWGGIGTWGFEGIEGWGISAARWLGFRRIEEDEMTESTLDHDFDSDDDSDYDDEEEDDAPPVARTPPPRHLVPRIARNGLGRIPTPPRPPFPDSDSEGTKFRNRPFLPPTPPPAAPKAEAAASGEAPAAADASEASLSPPLGPSDGGGSDAGSDGASLSCGEIHSGSDCSDDEGWVTESNPSAAGSGEAKQAPPVPQGWSEVVSDDSSDWSALRILPVDRNHIFGSVVDILLAKPFDKTIDVRFLKEPGRGVGPNKEFFSYVSPGLFHDEALALFSPITSGCDRQALRFNKSVLAHNKVGQGLFPQGSSDADPAPAAPPVPKEGEADADAERGVGGSGSGGPQQEPPVTIDQLRSTRDGLLKLYALAGKLMGFAFVNNFELGGGDLARGYYKILLSHSLGLDDAKAIDTDVHGSLRALMEEPSAKAIAKMDLAFVYSTSYEEGLPDGTTRQVVKEVELIEGGADIPVTKANRKRYVTAYVTAMHVAGVEPFLQAFCSGYWSEAPSTVNRFMITSRELRNSFRGEATISPDDWEASTSYDPPSASNTTVVRWFWQYVRSLSQEKLRQLLAFTTGSSTLPTGGFAHLGGDRFSIDVGSRAEEEMRLVFASPKIDKLLPTAHTCYNNLVLPPYPSYEVLQERMDIAVTLGHKGYHQT